MVVSVLLELRRAGTVIQQRGAVRCGQLLHLVLRGTPLLIQILLIYLGLPQVNWYPAPSAPASLPCR